MAGAVEQEARGKAVAARKPLINIGFRKAWRKDRLKAFYESSRMKSFTRASMRSIFWWLSQPPPGGKIQCSNRLVQGAVLAGNGDTLSFLFDGRSREASDRPQLT